MNDYATIRSAPSSQSVTRKSEKDGFMARKCYFSAQVPVNPGVLFVYFKALCFTCSETHHVKSQATEMKSVVPSGDVSAVSSSVLALLL